MEAILGVIIGGLIGFLSSFFIMRSQHKLSISQKEKNEKKQNKEKLSGLLHSYVEFWC